MKKEIEVAGVSMLVALTAIMQRDAARCELRRRGVEL